MTQASARLQLSAVMHAQEIYLDFRAAYCSEDVQSHREFVRQLQYAQEAHASCRAKNEKVL